MDMTEIIFDENEDWENRMLCSDESCIGTIGADGRCKECGKPYQGRLSQEQSVKNVQAVAVEEHVSANIESTDFPDDWDKRVLCGDESCIGTIGPDGKCKECGKPL
jgi:hypothetical protein